MDHDKSPSATAPPPRIRAVLFDMAGVLVPTLHSLWTDIETRMQLSANSIRDTHLSLRDEYARCELGELSIAEFETTFMNTYRTQYGDSVPFFSTFVFADRVYTDTDRVFAPMRQLLPALHAADYRLALVTNNYFLDTPRTRSALYIQPYVQYFDAVVESCRVGMKKPHRRIYEHALNALHIIDPTEAVFVDDTLANLTAPQEMGMHTIHVLSPEQAVSDLTRLLHL